jgi:hypothetical protein
MNHQPTKPDSQSNPIKEGDAASPKRGTVPGEQPATSKPQMNLPLTTTTGGPAEPVPSTFDNPKPTAGREEVPVDDFDISSLRIQPGADLIPTQKIYTVIPIRKPNKTEFVRVSDNRDFQLPCLIYIDPDDRDNTFVLLPNVVAAAGTEVPARRVVLHLAITRGGSPFLWPVPLPDPSGRSSTWQASASEAAQLAQSQWMRMAANMGNGSYDVTVAAAGVIPEPDWSSLPSFNELVRIATKGRIISDPDHLVLRKLRGEA